MSGKPMAAGTVVSHQFHQLKPNVPLQLDYLTLPSRLRRKMASATGT